MAIENKLYGARAIKEILGVKPEEVYLWSRTWGLFEPAIRAKGSRGRNKYDLDNLLDMGLIRELLMFGITPDAIKKIFSSAVTGESRLKQAYMGQNKEFPSMWEEIKRCRFEYELNGAVLLVDKGPLVDSVSEPPFFKKGHSVNALMLTLKSAMDNFFHFYLGAGQGAINFGTMIIVDLMAIVHLVETATEQKLKDSIA